MSWHVLGIGKPKALAAKLPQEFDRVTCEEPEQTIKAQVRDIVLLVLNNYPDGSAVKVSASGSQSKERDADKAVNSLNVTIEPLWGFIE